jgi:hypothetical protein
MLVLVVAVASSASAAAPPDQVVALNELYSSTGGAGWRNSSSWGVGDPCEQGGTVCRVRTGSCTCHAVLCRLGLIVAVQSNDRSLGVTAVALLCWQRHIGPPCQLRGRHAPRHASVAWLAFWADVSGDGMWVTMLQQSVTVTSLVGC